MGKGKDKSSGSPSPKSPRTRSDDSNFTFVREKLLRPDPLPAISVVQYPMSTSTEMAMAMGSDAHTLQEKMKGLEREVQKIQSLRDSHMSILVSIENLSEKIINDRKLTPAARTKLKSLYEKAVADAAEEAAKIKQALEKVKEIQNIRHELRCQAKNSGNKETIRRGALMKMLQNSAQTLPLWIGNPGEKPPPLCGAIPAEPGYVGKVGDMVAALVKSTDGEDNWILAQIQSHNPNTNKYEVDDIDEEQKEHHTLSRRRLHPLPLMRANPETNPEALFAKGSIVMALYPQTTCFYKAVVNRVPVLATEEYELLFEDASYMEGFSPPLLVAQRYMIQIKDNGKKK